MFTQSTEKHSQSPASPGEDANTSHASVPRMDLRLALRVAAIFSEDGQGQTLPSG